MATDAGGPARAVVDLLGALAYGELTAFERLAEDAQLAPTLADKAALAGMAAAEFGHFERLPDRLAELGADPAEAMEPFVAALDAFHEQHPPEHWLEGLVKAYVGDGIAADFYREIAAFLARARPGAGARGARRHRARRVRRRPRCGRRSRPTRGWPAGWRCGAAGWWARRCPRRSGWPPSGTPWRLLRRRHRATWPGSASC